MTYHRKHLKVLDDRVQVSQHAVKVTADSRGGFVHNGAAVVCIKHTQREQLTVIQGPEQKDTCYTPLTTQAIDNDSKTASNSWDHVFLAHEAICCTVSRWSMYHTHQPQYTTTQPNHILRAHTTEVIFTMSSTKHCSSS